jgi:hypothetical protein
MKNSQKPSYRNLKILKLESQLTGICFGFRLQLEKVSCDIHMSD